MTYFELPDDSAHRIESPLVDTCPGCKNTIRSAYTNTRYNQFTKQPWMDNVEVLCADDGSSVIHWKDAGMSDEYCAQFICLSDEYCDNSNLLRLRRERLGIEDIPVQRISPRAERSVESIGRFLQAVDVYVSDFIPDIPPEI